MTNTCLDAVLSGLLTRYMQRVPDVRRVFDALLQAGLITKESDIENDHIAFRTMGVPSLGIASLEKIFLALGYVRKDYYRFQEKKLNAFWYAPPEPKYPRIFISELCVHELSAEAQHIIKSYTREVPIDPVQQLDLNNSQQIDQFLHQALWRTPMWKDYERLLEESEYAAWVIYNRYYLNHFTISVHNLPAPYHTIERFNVFLEQHGILLNNAGGAVKVSPDGKLIQSSTVAELVDAEFALPDGGIEIRSIAGSYVEFAERRVLDEFASLPADRIRREHRREGFEAQNADKIFESTFLAQTTRKE
jgi:hypothetical protein